MIERIAHLFLRHRTELRGTKAARPVHQPAYRHLAHAVVKAHAHMSGIERDRASPARPGGVEAAVEAKSERRARAQRSTVGRRVGEECVSTCRSRWARVHLKKKQY